MGPDFPRLRAVAERGLLVEFGEEISEKIHARVTDLDHALAAFPPQGFVESVPAYASILVLFDPALTDHQGVAAALRDLLDRPAVPAVRGQEHVLGICYDADLAPDLDQVAAQAGLSPEAVIQAHLSGDYRVFMYGFAPGYAYMAGVPEAIRLPRKSAPIRDVPAGSVLIAGPQCLVSTLKMPTGWWIIGRSGTKILTGDADRPFLFEPGDRIRFRRISRAELEAGNG